MQNLDYPACVIIPLAKYVMLLSVGLELGLIATADCGDGLSRRNTSTRTITCQQSEDKI
jgi:hypothetical protein